MSHRLIRASAGTGKTYSLVESYARELVRGLSPSQIVVITFTEKAAFELKSRIRGRVRGLPSDEAAISDLGRAPINNFHGLSLDMLRRIGAPLGLSPGTEVLGEEGDDRMLFHDACLDAWLGERGLEDDVLAVAPVLDIETQLPEALWSALSRAREDDQRIVGAELVGRYDVLGLAREYEGRFAALRHGVATVRASLSDKARANVDAFLAAAPTAVGDDVLGWAKACGAALKLISRRGKLGEVIAADEMEFFRDKFAPHLMAEARCEEIAPHLARLIDAAWRGYEAKKRQLRVVDFGDLVEGAVRLLQHNGELQHELTRGVRAVLVDEAQDTNRLQYRFVRLIARLEGPLAGNEPASLHVVGDKKQAIYTFRGADPGSFDAFARDIAELSGVEETLETSYRSAAPIVRGVNELGAMLFGASYERLVAHPERSEAGRVTWLRVEAEDVSRAQAMLRESRAVAALVRSRVDGGEPPRDFTVLVSAMTHAPLYARALLDLGVPALLGGGGGFYAQPEIIEVVHLVRWLCDPQASLSAAIALRAPIVGLGDATLLRLFWPGQAGSQLLALRRGNVPLADPASDDDKRALARLSSVVPRLVRAAELMPPGDLLRYADELLDLSAVYLAQPGGEQRVANLIRLTQIADGSSARGGVGRFSREQLARIAQKHREPVSPVTTGDAGAVTITTVHQSKGLEYPVVLVCDIGNKTRGETSPIVHSRAHGLVIRPRADGHSVQSRRFAAAIDSLREESAEEKKRLLYVAVTRAMRELVIVDSAKDAHNGFAIYLKPFCERGVREGFVEHVEPGTSAPAPPVGAPVSPDTLATLAQGLLPAKAAVGHRLTVPVTALETYVQCLRRGVFVHELGLAEDNIPARLRRSALREADDDGMDPLARGRLAHAVLAALERFSEHDEPRSFISSELLPLGYDADDPRLSDIVRDVEAFLTTPLGTTLKNLAPRARRPELPFQFVVDAAPYELLVHGQMDLLYFDADGPVVVDYKHAKSSGAGLAAYATQLDAYAYAVARMCNVSGTVRTRLVFLKDPERAPLVRDVTPEMRASFVQRAAEVARTLVRAQGELALWPGQARERCRALDCGFIQRCHAAQPGAQLHLV